MRTRNLGQDLGSDTGHGLDDADGFEEDDSPGELSTLFDSSPASEVQTSTAAMTAFVLGLFTLLAVPFPLAMALCVGLAAVALVSSIFGMARASKPGFAGGLLASVGLLLALITLALVGLRYIGVDTAVGDAFVPTIRGWLDALNTLMPTP